MKNFNPLRQLKLENSDVKELESLVFEAQVEKAVLGIDIYRYSEYPVEKQAYIPILFDFIYILCVQDCIEKEEFFFKKYTDLKAFKKHFISTGDGGFQIFSNPLEAIVFLIYFQTYIKKFNAGTMISTAIGNLHNVIGNIELRYTLTFDKILSFNSNFYGAGIINNARILAKDRLNRCLSDNNTYQWFEKNLNGFENLMVINKSDLLKTNYFKKHQLSLKSDLFDDTKTIVKAASASKIGDIQSKNTSISVYNFFIQILINRKSSKNYSDYVISLGNLNTKGIE